jgi:hypothetical protein
LQAFIIEIEMRKYRFFAVGVTLVIAGGVAAYLGISGSGTRSSGLGAVSGGITSVGVAGVLVGVLGIGVLILGAVRN